MKKLFLEGTLMIYNILTPGKVCLVTGTVSFRFVSSYSWPHPVACIHQTDAMDVVKEITHPGTPGIHTITSGEGGEQKYWQRSKGKNRRAV